MSETTDRRPAVAVVGLACRVPGASDVRQFWRNLRDGVESIRRLDRDDMLKAGIAPADLADPKHVPAGALIDDVDLFDAGFFGVTARDAELMDPQHRIFLECAWQALEDAGYDPARYDGAISVFGGGIFNSYLTRNLVPGGVFDDKAGVLHSILANEKDYMVTRVAHKLDLRGVACNVQTGCSTSLVAVHLACQSLLNYESDMALAGGIAIDLGRGAGYQYHEGSVYSPDGHCRAFDAEAGGTVFGNGAGMVVLKRLEDALADGDAIRAIVLGTAVNNDGSLKVGFTAPSLTGQSRVITEALADAGVSPDTIGYVEAHGTGTALGDPIEIQAMVKAFGPPAPGARCPIGSVKSNIGHLDAAAGVVGLIKTVLALQHRLIPPTVHFRRPNPQLEIERTQFFIAGEPLPWTAGARPGVPRRAGVSSFGMGGTNAHVILEEPPPTEATEPLRPAQLVVLSARSAGALDRAAEQLASHLESGCVDCLADAAYTLQAGRAVFAHRRAVVCRDTADAAAALRDPNRQRTHAFDGRAPRIAFMFPGQGSQYPGMARGLYRTEPVFRREFDRCSRALAPQIDLVALVTDPAVPAEQLARTDHAQPALFAVEYALAQLWRHWGVDADASIGHSVGEYVAACLAGVFAVEDALRLVAARGRLMQHLPTGAMSAVPLPPDRCAAELSEGVELAAVNAPALSVVAGSVDAVGALEQRLRARGIECRRLHTSHAFHSEAMDPAVERFAELASAVPMRKPERRFVSNVTGTWITDADATSPGYWARHLRQPVLFSRGIETLAADGATVLLEVGPGRALGTLARLQAAGVAVAASLPAATERAEDHDVLLQALGLVWMHGGSIEWSRLYEGERRRRVPLPTYPFERTRHWVDPDEEQVERRRARERAGTKNPVVENWLYVRGWKERFAARTIAPEIVAGAPIVVLGGDSPVARQVVRGLESRAGSSRVIVATMGAAFARLDDRRFTFNAGRAADYDRLLAEAGPPGAPLRIVHLGNAEGAGQPRAEALETGFYSAALLGAALARRSREAPVCLSVVTATTEDVVGSEPIAADRATLGGICLVLPQEQPQIRCRRVDVLPEGESLSAADVRALVTEIVSEGDDPLVAIRAGRRWIPAVEPLEAEPQGALPLRQGGHYLIVGGFGTIGFSLACYLAAAAGARLSLVGRRRVPDAAGWQAWLDTHPAGDPTSALIVRAAHLERSGIEHLAIAADASDGAALRGAIERAEQRFGPIHGVVSAAGLMDETAFAPIPALDREKCERHFRPKLDGLPALEAALGDRPLDFCVVTSSLSSLLGGLGYSAYAAANCYVDAFVRRHNRRSASPWSLVNWDAWHPIGGQLSAASPLARLAMTPAEGVRAFDRALRYEGLTQVCISTADLPARVDRWTRPGPATASPAAEPVPAAQEGAPDGDASALTPTERVVIDIWQQVLGIGYVDVHDRFLDLGGSSLTAIQVIDRLESALGVRVTIEEFIFQTAAQLAAACDARREAPVAPAEPVGAGGSGQGGWTRLRGLLRPRSGADARDGADSR